MKYNCIFPIFPKRFTLPTLPLRSSKIIRVSGFSILFDELGSLLFEIKTPRQHCNKITARIIARLSVPAPLCEEPRAVIGI